MLPCLNIMGRNLLHIGGSVKSFFQEVITDQLGKQPCKDLLRKLIRTWFSVGKGTIGWLVFMEILSHYFVSK